MAKKTDEKDDTETGEPVIPFRNGGENKRLD